MRVARTIERHAMFAPRDKVLVGVSGGPDSVALVHMLCKLAPAKKFELAVAHLNHGLRPVASDQEADFVKKLVHGLGLRFHLDQIRLNINKGSVEERARQARYDFYYRLAKNHGYTKIALGHHADDNAEAVLQHLLRGSGLRGLAGIPPKRDDLIVRPLIDIYRADIMSYVNECRLPYVLDASNNDLRFERNRIRHHLIPLIQKQYNPNIIAILHRMANLCREEESWFQTHLQPQLDHIIAISDITCLDLKAPALAVAPLAVQRRLIRDALRQWRGDLRRVGAGHIDAAIGLLPSHRKGKRLNMPGRITVERTTNHLRFTWHRKAGHLSRPTIQEFCYEVSFPKKLPLEVKLIEADCRLRFTTAGPQSLEKCIMKGNKSAWFDLDQLRFPLTIRNFRAGDRLAPFGLAGTQKLKKLFIDRKIPQADRHRIPLLVSGNTILWVIGVRRSAAATLSTASKRALCVEVLYKDLDNTCETP